MNIEPTVILLLEVIPNKSLEEVVLFLDKFMRGGHEDATVCTLLGLKMVQWVKVHVASSDETEKLISQMILKVIEEGRGDPEATMLRGRTSDALASGGAGTALRI